MWAELGLPFGGARVGTWFSMIGRLFFFFGVLLGGFNGGVVRVQQAFRYRR